MTASMSTCAPLDESMRSLGDEMQALLLNPVYLVFNIGSQPPSYRLQVSLEKDESVDGNDSGDEGGAHARREMRLLLVRAPRLWYLCEACERRC